MDKTYQLSYHQIRVLALSSLIFSHSLSFCNQIIRSPLENLPGFILIAFFSTFGVLFIPLAGASFRLAMQDRIKSNRLFGAPPWRLYKYLAILIFIEGLKESLMTSNLDQFLHWNFLKTIFLALVMIDLFGRIHIFAILAASIAISWNIDRINLWISSQVTTVGQVTDQLTTWNAVHVTMLTFLLIPSLWILVATYRSQKPHVFKLWIYLGVCLAIYAVALSIMTIQPTIDRYLAYKNWFLWGLSGANQSARLYSGIAWIPSTLNGFLLAHLALPLKPRIEQSRKIALAFSLPMVLLTYYFYHRHVAVPTGLINVWDISEFRFSSFATEMFKAASLANLYILFLVFNVSIRAKEFGPTLAKLSQASFIVYIVCTTVAIWSSNLLARHMSLFWATLNTTAITALMSVAAALGAHWISSKRLRLKLVRA